MRLCVPLLAAFFSFAGSLHFVRPRPYEAIVPPPFPKKESVAISGVAEIAGALAVLHPATRQAGRWWTAGAAGRDLPRQRLHGGQPGEDPRRRPGKIPRWALWARLPLQPLAMLWVWRATGD